MFDDLVGIVTESSWAYALVFALALLDAVLPIVPSEAVVVGAAALAVSGRLSLVGVYLSAVAGAAVGDNAAYALGRLSTGAVHRVARRPRAGAALDWAAAMLRTRGPTIVVVSRFVPGGRTATMLTAGATRLAWPRFAALDGAAAVIWAGYGVALGALGGVAFADRPFVAVGVTLALAACLAVALEALRRLLRWA